MNKRELEEVKKSLECCVDPSAGGCRECPYNIYKYTCRYELMFAASRLLDEVEVEDEG